MSQYWLEWLTLVSVFGVAVMAPGPDFVMAVRNALTYGRAAGVWTALGFGCGVCVHVAYTLLGIAVLVSQSILLFSVLKYAGAAYLVYIGFKALKSKGMARDETGTNVQAAKPLPAWKAFRSGFVTNLLNPKATLFFLALFTQIARPETPMAVQILFGLTCVVMVVLWFTAVAFFLTTPRVRAGFLKISAWIDRTCGALFIALGCKLALSRAP